MIYTYIHTYIYIYIYIYFLERWTEITQKNSSPSVAAVLILHCLCPLPENSLENEPRVNTLTTKPLFHFKSGVQELRANNGTKTSEASKHWKLPQRVTHTERLSRWPLCSRLQAAAADNGDWRRVKGETSRKSDGGGRKEL